MPEEPEQQRYIEAVLTKSASGMARAIRLGEISCLDLMAAHLRRIESVNSALNAAVQVFAAEAMESARQADQDMAAGRTLGALHGVPFSVKDSLDVAGYRTTAGTWGRRAVPVATEDAALVARLRAAGGIPIAKTNLPDLLFSYESDNLIFGRSNNPYDLERTAGGSSGGEAALIAAGGSPLGLGSDAAGSVRVPAAFCGITAIKPTSGCLARRGHVPGAGGRVAELWQIGPMARRVEDLQLAMSLLTPDVRSSIGTEAVRPQRVAFFTDNGFASCRADVRSVVEAAAAALSERGLSLEQVRPPGVEEAYDLEMRLLGADGGDGIDAYLREAGSDRQHWLLHAGFMDRMRPLRCSTSEFGTLWARWDRYRDRMEEFFSRFDAVLCPVYTEAALRHGESAQPGKFEGFSYTMAWNVAGNPAAVVPCAQCEGLPIGVQVVAPLWKEGVALQICAMLEEQFGGWQAPQLVNNTEVLL